MFKSKYATFYLSQMKLEENYFNLFREDFCLTI